MFYDKFLRLCEQNDITKTAACTGAGLSDTAWIRWEAGSTPNSRSMKKLCEYFGVSVQSMYDDSSEIVYESDATKARQDLLENTEMKVLFDAAKDVPAYKLYEVAAQLMKWKEDNNIDT